MKRGVPAVLLAGLLLLLSSACGDDDDNADPTTTAGETTTTTSPTTTEATSTTAAPDLAEAVKAAYLAYWEMYYRVNDPPNPQDPEITALTTGPALEALLDVIDTNIEMGTVFRHPASSIAEHRVEVTAIAGDAAYFTDCDIDDGLVIQAATGAIVNDTVATKLIEGSLVLEDGGWRVFQYEFVERVEGVGGCAAG